MTVETPLYRAVFSSTGASIKSFKLKKYHLTADPDSPLVELARGQAPLVTIQFDPSGKKDTSPVVYHVNEQFTDPGGRSLSQGTHLSRHHVGWAPAPADLSH